MKPGQAAQATDAYKAWKADEKLPLIESKGAGVESDLTTEDVLALSLASFDLIRRNGMEF